MRHLTARNEEHAVFQKYQFSGRILNIIYFLAAQDRELPTQRALKSMSVASYKL